MNNQITFPYFVLDELPDEWVLRKSWPEAPGIYKVSKELDALYFVSSYSVSFISLGGVEHQIHFGGNDNFTKNTVLELIAATQGKRLV